jgi:uncharacterized protein
MNKIFKKLCLLFLILIITLLNVHSSLASDYPEFVGYVNDYAHLLSAPQASALNQELRDFDNRTTIEVAVVTLNSIGSDNPQDYAISIANYWGVGKRDKNNGIIFLVAMQSHDIWIEVGPGLSGQFSDRQIQQIVDDVIIPQFRADHPDQGVINGVHSIINHFKGAAIPAAKPAANPVAKPTANPMVPQSSRDNDIGNPNFFKYVTELLVIVLAGILLAWIIARWLQSKKNNAKISDLKGQLNDMVDKEGLAFEALRELKANYMPSLWKCAEDAFSLVDHNNLELELLGAERVSRKGLIFAGSARSKIDELESSFEKANLNVEAPIKRLADARNAQKECPEILAGLDAAFKHAEEETTGYEISMSTRMNLGSAQHAYREASSQAQQPVDAVDWIDLLARLVKLREEVEQIGKDALRDREIAEKIKDLSPEEIMGQMKKTLESAEKTMGPLGAAKSDLKAARTEYERISEYRSGRMNSIDLYLTMHRMDTNIEQGREHHKQAVEKAMREAEHKRATSTHHSGFGSSGSDSFGGGSMGGGSHGGGKW